MSQETDKHMLITNLEWVKVNGIRTYTHALLITEGEAPLDRNARRRQVRGFGADPAWPVFELDVPSIEFTLQEARGTAIMITDSEPGGFPLVSDAIMQLAGGPRVDLVTCDRHQPLDVQRFTGSILRMWEVLPTLVRRYWTAPNFPILQWGMHREAWGGGR